MGFERSITGLATLSLLLLSLMLAGCGGGGVGGSNATTASVTVHPLRFDFGLVTDGNSASPQTFSIENAGNIAYHISDIRLAGNDPDFFHLNLSGGADPCGSAPLSISPGDSCTLEVGLAPISFRTYRAALIIQSNDPNALSVGRALTGTYAEILSANVAVSQVNACPRDQGTVFVSVTDEGGFPVKGLDANNFSLAESSDGIFGDGTPPAHASTLAGSVGFPLSLSLVMDYSNSILNAPFAQDNMEKAASTLVSNLGTRDEAEVVKYARTFEITQSFTSEVELLENAIKLDPDVGLGTALYDAVVAAVKRATERPNPRKAVIALTDGRNNVGVALRDAVSEANRDGTPVFTVGFGDFSAKDLKTLASDTGGVFYKPPAADNLEETYQRIANLLFREQYVLTYESKLPAGGGQLNVVVEFEKSPNVFLRGKATRTIRECL